MSDDAKKDSSMLAAGLSAVSAVPTADHPPKAAPQTLEGLYEAHQKRVYRAAYRVTGNATDAEDVLQTVFMRLARHKDLKDLGVGAAGYLHRAAVNASLDLLRARKRARAVDLDSAEAQLFTPDSEGPEGQQDRKELRALLRDAVSRLSPKAAEVFSLRYFEGYGNLEISRMLGTSQTAVAVILHRTRNKLQNELQHLAGG